MLQVTQFQVAIYRCLRRAKRPATIKEIAKATGHPPRSVRQTIKRFEQAALLDTVKTWGGYRYALNPKNEDARTIEQRLLSAEQAFGMAP